MNRSDLLPGIFDKFPLSIAYIHTESIARPALKRAGRDNRQSEETLTRSNSYLAHEAH